MKAQNINKLIRHKNDKREVPPIEDVLTFKKGYNAKNPPSLYNLTSLKMKAQNINKLISHKKNKFNLSRRNSIRP
jgi:hypothetical protein